MFRRYIAVCSLAIVAYYNTLEAGFVYDDNRAILTNPDVVSSLNLNSLFHNDFWGSPLSSSNSHGSYRPITVATFCFNFQTSGLNPMGYHLTNVILHTITTGLVLHTGRVVVRRQSQTLAAIMFAVHPVNTEAVAGIVGRADLLACIFYLLSFNAYVMHLQIKQQRKCNNIYTVMKHFDNTKSNIYHLQSHNYKIEVIYLIASVLFGISATFCKEIGITVFMISAIFDILFQIRQNYKIQDYLSLFTLTFSFTTMLFFRVCLMGIKLPTFSKSDNPTSHNPSFVSRTLTFFYLPVVNFQIFVYPKLLSFDWSMDSIQTISNIWDARNVLSLIFYWCIYYTLKLTIFKCITNKIKYNNCKVCFYIENNSYKHSINNNNILQNDDHFHKVYLTNHHSVIMCLAFLIVPFIPATNLLFYVGFVIAERVLYTPNIGYCFIVAFGWEILSKKVHQKFLRITALSFLFILTMRTIQRNRDWKNEENLYRSSIKINPPKAYGNLGSILSTQGRIQEAESAFLLALSYRPNMAEVHYNLGNLQLGLKKYKDAIMSYEHAIKFRPSLAVAHLNLGILLASLGQCDRAELVLKKCSQLESTGLKDLHSHQKAKVNAMINLGQIYYHHAKFKETIGVCKKGMTMEADQHQMQVLQNLLNKTLHQIGRFGNCSHKSVYSLKMTPFLS